MKKVIKIFIALFLGASTSLIAADRPPALVEVTTVKKGSVNPLQNFVGTVEYVTNSELASKESGAIEAIHFKEGDLVEKGTTLFTLDSKLLDLNIIQGRNALKALNADLEKQEKDYVRIEKLYNNKSISEQNFDSTKFALEKLQAQYASTKASLDSLLVKKSHTAIKAPFTGVVTTRYKDIGEWVNTGEKVANLVDISDLEIELNIPARFISFLNRESYIRTYVEGKEVETKIKALIPSADTRTRTFPVKLQVVNPEGIIGGMSANVSLPSIEKTEALLVPRDAVIKKFGQEIIFLANDGKAIMTPVKVVGFNDGKAAVTGQGIVFGAQVVVKGNERIFPNSPIRIMGQ